MFDLKNNNALSFHEFICRHARIISLFTHAGTSKRANFTHVISHIFLFGKNVGIFSLPVDIRQNVGTNLKDDEWKILRRLGSIDSDGF